MTSASWRKHVASIEEQTAKLKAGIVALEAQRAHLGEEVVEAMTATIRE